MILNINFVGDGQKCTYRQSALYLLKMKEKKFLSQVAINEIVEETSSIVARTLNMYSAGIRDKLAHAGVDVSTIDLNSVFSDIPEPFDGLKSRHYQEKYFKETMGLIVSFCYTCVSAIHVQ